eukprot:SAG22_NODE_1922_length_3307_cov_1.973504_1_plen_385_part_00
MDDPHLEAAAHLIPTVGQADDRAVAADIARQSLVLLENTGGALPLAAGARILVTGPAADSRRLLCGGWTNHWQGPVDDSESEFPYQQPTVAQKLRELHGAANVVTEPGITFAHRTSEPSNSDAHDASGRAAALQTAAAVDVVVLVFGEEVYAEKPGDIKDLELPLLLRQYAADLIATGTPVVAVLVEGRPRLLRGALDGAAAVVWAGLPGPEGGTAIGELLAGAFSPSGRLPISYPATDTNLGYGGQYWHAVTEQCNGPDRTVALLDRFPHWGSIGRPEPGGCFHQWAFGSGEPYTDFAYSGLTLSTPPSGGLHVSQLETGVTVSVTVTNTGTSSTASAAFTGPADHTVLLFLTDEVGATHQQDSLWVCWPSLPSSLLTSNCCC